MDEKRYYDFMTHGVKWKDQPNVNGHGFITFDGIPFYDIGDAVKYIMKQAPDAEPKDKLIIEDKEECAKAAHIILKEVLRLLNVIETLKDEVFQETDRKAKERDSIPGESILEEIHKQLLQEEVYRNIGKHSGLSDAWRLLHSRAYELLRCRGLL